MGTLEDVGVSTSHPPESVLVKSWLLRLLGRQIVAAENVSVGRELGTRPALHASAKAGLWDSRGGDCLCSWGGGPLLSYTFL